ncbi:MAG TPA: sigma-70 family RNA polymerase sigma factor [Phototrophicaceae bacterium]|nr:sigma-70 family RNA polymerase sigma factor [Phototrophicaceae bacterium]
MKRTPLRQFIEDESHALTRTLSFYLSRAGLTVSASELLNEVVVEALRHEDRFNPARQPRAWLLGIAANLIRREQSQLAKLNQREPLARDLYPGSEPSDDEVFEWLSSFAENASSLENAEAVNVLLDGVSPDDAHVLRLAILNGLDGDALARELGVTPGAARVRLHRALNRLRRTVQAERDRGDE